MVLFSLASPLCFQHLARTKLQKRCGKEEIEEREKDVSVDSVQHEDSTNKEPLGGFHKLFNSVDRTVHCKSEQGHDSRTHCLW